MKYLFLDANIYIDMIVSRNSNHKADSYELLKKLLDFDKVKIILPSIVKVETTRNLIKEVASIGSKVKAAKKAIEAVYWINHVQEIENYNNKISPLRSTLGSLDDEFSKSETKYINDASNKITNLFEYENVKTIEDTDDLILKVQKRRIFKLCPFHIEQKDSYGDALIIETLLNIKDYINLLPEDQIYFITGNYKDFSSKESKVKFHPDIEKELIEKGLNNQVHYRTYYTKTLLQDFMEEVKEAEIIKDLLAEEAEEAEARLQQEKKDYASFVREGLGVESLGDEDQYIDEISESGEISELMSLINTKVSMLIQELENLLEEHSNLIENIHNEPFSTLKTKVFNYNQISPFLKIDWDSGNVEGELHYAIDSFINDNICSADYLQELLDSIKYSDFFKVEQLFEMRDLNDNLVSVEVVGELDPCDYGSDFIEIYVEKNNRSLERSNIKIHYGFAEYNDDGGVGDAQDPSIDYNLDDVKEKFEEIIDLNLSKLVAIKDNMNKISNILI